MNGYDSYWLGFTCTSCARKAAERASNIYTCRTLGLF